MAIRCASKAIIIENGCILMNRCRRENGEVDYDLPGGGQKVYESMEETVVREVKEETGYDVRVDGWIGLAEEIYTNDALRAQFPEYTHRIFHLFKAHIAGGERTAPTELDFGMEASEWVPLGKVDGLERVNPAGVKELLKHWDDMQPPRFLGTKYIDESAPSKAQQGENHDDQ